LREPGWPPREADGRAATPRRPRAAGQTTAQPGYPAGPAGQGRPRSDGTPGREGRGTWVDPGPRGQGRRPEPRPGTPRPGTPQPGASRPGTGPYNFSSGA
jgi:translation initiation factor IF-2